MPKGKTAQNDTPARTLPTMIRGVEILDSGRGRPVQPSIVIEDATWSLGQSRAGKMGTAWCAAENVSIVTEQELVREWSRAARQLGCGLSRRRDEHANGTVTLAFRCQDRRPKASKGEGKDGTKAA